MLERTIGIWTLTHRGNVLDDANQFIKYGLSGDVALVDGITAADGLEGVIRPILSRLPLQLGWVPKRARCEGDIGVAGLYEVLIELVERTGNKFGPLVRGVEGVMDRAHEEDRLELVVPARPGVVVSGLRCVSVVSYDYEWMCVQRASSWSTL